MDSSLHQASLPMGFSRQEYWSGAEHQRIDAFFFFNFILLYSTVLVLPYINMNPPRVYTCSQSSTPLPSPSLYHPSGSLFFFFFNFLGPRASLAAQLVKNPHAIRETWVRSLGWEDPLEKGKAAHSSILVWRILWTVESMGSQRVGHN